MLKFDKNLNRSNNPDILEELYEKLPAEKIQLKFLKMLLGLHKTSRNIAVRSELGIYPIVITALPLMIKYWLII